MLGWFNLDMDENILFGIAGIPINAKPKTTEGGIQRIAELGLGCMELQFGRGINMPQDMAREVGELAKEHDVKLSAHAPYYINFNAHDEKKLAASRKMLAETVRIACTMQAEAVVFHPAFYLKDPPAEVYVRVKDSLAEAASQLRKEDNQVELRAETTGKASQFGSLEEILNLCADIDCVVPCIDFAHLHSRRGALNSYAEFVGIINLVVEKLGWQAIDHMHIHISGIEYSSKGEINHLRLKDSDLRFKDLLEALKDLDVKGRVICESPDEHREEDALLLQETYNSI